MVGSRKLGVDKVKPRYLNKVFDKGINSANPSPRRPKKRILGILASRSSLLSSYSLWRYGWIPPGAVTKSRCEEMLEGVILDTDRPNKENAHAECRVHDDCTIRPGVHVDLTVVFSGGHWRFDRVACPEATARPRTLIEIKRARSDSVSAAIQARGRVDSPDNESARATLTDVEVLGVHRDTSDL